MARVTYANRFLESKAFCAAKETGKITYAEFATDPCRTLFGRVAAIFDPKLTDNCCVNVSGYAREAVAFTETTMPMRFSPDTLKTLGVFGYRRAFERSDLHRAPALRREARLPLQLHRRSRHEEPVSRCAGSATTASRRSSPSFRSSARLICTASA